MEVATNLTVFSSAFHVYVRVEAYILPTPLYTGVSFGKVSNSVLES